MTPKVLFAQPIVAAALEIHTSCNLKLTRVTVNTLQVGTGDLAPKLGSSTIWYALSGNNRTFTAIQLTTTNDGPAADCTYTVKAGYSAVPVGA